MFEICFKLFYCIFKQKIQPSYILCWSCLTWFHPFLYVTIFAIFTLHLLHLYCFASLFVLQQFSRCCRDRSKSELFVFGMCFVVWMHLCVLTSLYIHVCVCLQTFCLSASSLICFGSVCWAGHGANYLLKGKSEPNKPHWATEERLNKRVSASLAILHNILRHTEFWLSRRDGQ